MEAMNFTSSVQRWDEIAYLKMLQNCKDLSKYLTIIGRQQKTLYFSIMYASGNIANIYGRDTS